MNGDRSRKHRQRYGSSIAYAVTGEICGIELVRFRALNGNVRTRNFEEGVLHATSTWR